MNSGMPPPAVSPAKCNAAKGGDQFATANRRIRYFHTNLPSQSEQITRQPADRLPTLAARPARFAISRGIQTADPADPDREALQSTKNEAGSSERATVSMIPSIVFWIS